MEQVVIIGSGPAGYTAAIYCARAGLRPLVIEGPQPGGQLVTTTNIENYPGFPKGINGTELMELMRAQAEHFGAQIRADEVTKVDFKRQPFIIDFAQSSPVEAKCVIIATGASAIYLGLDSEQKLIGHGVSGCATCDGALYRDNEVAVVGGGDTAMEDALFLTRFAAKVTVIHRRDRFRASKIMAERVSRHPKIKIMWNSIVTEVLDVSKMEVEALNIKDVVTGKTSRLPVAGLFVAVGHKPNTDIFKGQVAMDEKGYITTTNTRTSAAGVFAAGDVQDHSYRQAVTAAGSGCMAAIEAERFLGKG
jgi:thioredoxin reductase (NADPH)